MRQWQKCKESFFRYRETGDASPDFDLSKWKRTESLKYEIADLFEESCENKSSLFLSQKIFVSTTYCYGQQSEYKSIAYKRK